MVRAVAYILGYLVAVTFIVAPIAMQFPIGQLIGWIVAGISVAVDTTLVIAWNKSGRLQVGATKGGIELRGLFDLDGWQWWLVAAILLVGGAAIVIGSSIG